MIQKTGNPETFLCHDFKMCSKMVVKEEVVLTALRHNVDETTPIQCRLGTDCPLKKTDRIFLWSSHFVSQYFIQ